jgi:hypothetical protein
LAALAQDTPQAIKIQGFLTDRSSGTPLPAIGTHDMMFEVYDAEVAGILVASVGPLEVLVDQGRYEVELPLSRSVFSGPDCFLQITVDGELLEPRIRITSVPYAYHAETASSASDVEPGSIDTDSLAPGSVDSTALATGAVTAEKIGVICAAGEVLVYDGLSWICSPTSVAQICSPGSFIQCYSGSAGTLNVGVCRAGTSSCNVAGTGFESCMGEVLPGTEDCANGTDDDCDSALDCADPDCGACPGCGDGTCDSGAGEDCTNCAADCGACPSSPTAGPARAVVTAPATPPPARTARTVPPTAAPARPVVTAPATPPPARTV